ncbi:serine protease inhibitor [Nocardiopsis sp. RSe5-2]|uniref:Serine protease inhibitor n=1 Tax=Nocardiopsis endophytica TaxID=3018445 RepID=A0ABT4TYI4_9ACTN|nr:serine protease inhibitor [Nocardiopsis endophytica]MDA2809759.1 serine protease inhibitor [Nocardiopsis endophytica]
MHRVTLAGSVLACATALTALLPATAGAAEAGAGDTSGAALCTGKQSWPELAGADAHTAERVIERENPRVDAVLVPKGSFVTMDFRCDRVHVFHEGEDPAPLIVSRAPQVG